MSSVTVIETGFKKKNQWRIEKEKILIFLENKFDQANDKDH